jgi:hypothetical protein
MQRLDRAAEVAQQRADSRSENDQARDRQNGNECDDQSVFNEALRLFADAHAWNLDSVKRIGKVRGMSAPAAKFNDDTPVLPLSIGVR